MILLIDTSYLSFHKFFSILRWYSFKNTEEYKLIKDNPKYNFLENKDFMDKYNKLFLDGIFKIVKNKFDKIIFCRDDIQGNLWRNQLTNDYKGGRIDMTLKYNFKPVFKYTYDILIPKLLNNHIHQIFIKNIEADDIIAVFTKIYHQEIYIVSGDHDMLQLLNDRIKLIDLNKKKIIEMNKEEAKIKLMEKIINGDSSDNIKGIFYKKRINKDIKEKLIKDKTFRKEYLKENKEINERFKENRLLIDFKKIPKEIQLNIKKEIKKLI